MSDSPIDPTLLDRLADVAVHTGLNIQPGQQLVITAPADALPLVRRITTAAYKAGASLVTPILSDADLTLARFQHGADDSFDTAAGWLYRGMADAYAGGAARLAIVGEDPML
ncbi:aminopeptidase, partial [Salipiger aestuarii]